MLDKAFLSHLKAATDVEVLTAPSDCWTYGYDNSRLHAMPDAVVFPLEHEQVAAIVGKCYQHRIAITARGRGTNTTGATVPTRGGIVMSFERMKKIIEINAGDHTLRSQPGALNTEIQNYCKPYGLFWPPDPSSADYSTLGGNLACNAAGPRAVKYGTARENTLGLKAVTGDGKSIVTGTQTTKGVVGLDLTRLIVGSEGTLAMITEATLKLIPSPPHKRIMRACYHSVEAAAHAVTAIMAQAATPSALELMDATSVRLVHRHGDVKLHAETQALLLIEADGDHAALAAAVEGIQRAATNEGLISFDIANNPGEAKKLREARKKLSPTLRSLATGKINEDVVVPVSQLAVFIRKIHAIGDRHRLNIASFGHAGNGNLHVNVLYESKDPEQKHAAERCVSEIFDATLALGGTLSGEHGVGLVKKNYVAREISPETLELSRRIMRVFDPRGIFNPGKGIPSPEVPRSEDPNINSGASDSPPGSGYE